MKQAERPVLRRWARHEYERLIDHGFFDGDDPIELLDGLLLVKEPPHSSHRTAVRLAAKMVLAALAGAPGTLLDRIALTPLVSALRGQVTVYESEQSTYKDGLYAEQWMAAQCGIEDVQAILPEHWRNQENSVRRQR
jgi:hypothetical protein